MIPSAEKILIGLCVVIAAAAMGAHVGGKLASASCDAGKAAAVSNNLDIKVKNDEIRNNRPSGSALIDKLRRGEL